MYDNASSPSSPSYQDKAAAGDSAERELQIREWQDELEKVKAVKRAGEKELTERQPKEKNLFSCVRECVGICVLVLDAFSLIQ